MKLFLCLVIMGFAAGCQTNVETTGIGGNTNIKPDLRGMNLEKASEIPNEPDRSSPSDAKDRGAGLGKGS